MPELSTPLTHPLYPRLIPSFHPRHPSPSSPSSPSLSSSPAILPTPFIPSIHPSRCPQALQSRGYQKLVLQVGRGSLPQPQPSSSSPAVEVEVFRFKDSLAEDLQSADLVISHAGTAPSASRGSRALLRELGGMKSLRLSGELAGNVEVHS